MQRLLLWLLILCLPALSYATAVRPNVAGMFAAGAVVGDWAGQQVYQNLKGNDPNAVLVAVADTQGLNGTATFFAGIAGGAAAAAVGGKDRVEQSFGIGQSTSQNAFENNYLQHQERQQLREAEKDCYQSGQQCDTVTALKRKDELSDQLLQRDGSNHPH